jgi:Glyoxalase-like domain
MPGVVSAITIDCLDPGRLAAFWGALLEREEEPSLPGWRQLGGRGGPALRINFQPVPEAKQGKARLHLDVTVGDIDEGVGSVLRLGGRETGERHEYDEGVVVVMADPEGNEFCLVQYYEQAPGGG